MKNDSISLLLLVLLSIGRGALAARDIFEGMHARSTDEPSSGDIDLGDGDDELNTCVDAIVPEHSIQLEPNLGPLAKVQNVLNEIPQAPPMPTLPLIWSQVANIVQMPRFSEMGQEIKSVVDQYRAVVEIYGKQWMGFFNKRRREAVDQVKAVVQQENAKIKKFFSNHFEEYRDVCLPQANTCLLSIQKHLEGYTRRVNKNVAACKTFVDRQLHQHARWVEAERTALERPFLRIDGCFEKGHIGSSVTLCVGNSISNMDKLVTDGMGKFSGKMSQASASLADRMRKFQECVVTRKKLLDQGRERIAQRAKDCLGSQLAGGGDGEIFS